MLRLATIWVLSGILAASAFLLSPSEAQSSPVTDGEQDTQCVETDNIESYKVESDERVRLKLKNGGHVLLLMKRHCPQLYFHRYISYTPVNGRICAGSDEIRTRAGLRCRIGSIQPIKKTATAPKRTGKNDVSEEKP